LQYLAGVRATILTLALLLGGAVTLEAQTRPDPGVSPVSGPAGPPAGVPGMAPRPPAGCLETRGESPSVPAFDFEGRRFEASGIPEPIQAENLDSMGTLGELPVYVGRLAGRPVVDLWVPVCRPAGHYQLFTRAGS
jgi:hypothetical protein